jgi:hypothetical protein
MPNRSILNPLLSGRLTLEFFIEGEKGFLRCIVDISSSSSATAELRRGTWETRVEERCGLGSRGAFASLGSLEGVACAAATREDIFPGVWVWLGDCVA